MTTSTAGLNRMRQHVWEATAEQLRRHPRKVVFVSIDGRECANPFTLASAARGGLHREGLLVSIETSFLDNGIYVGFVRDLRRKRPS